MLAALLSVSLPTFLIHTPLRLVSFARLSALLQRPKQRPTTEFGKLPSRKAGSTAKSASSSEKTSAVSWADTNTWHGVGPREDDWGEQYAGLSMPAIFVLDTDTGSVVRVSPEKDERSFG